MLLAVMLLPFASQAQSTLTVADSTATNSYVPVHGNYMDDPLGCQSIYPAEMLTNMVGESILSLHYYVSSGASTNWGSKPMLVKMMIVDSANLSNGYIDITNATTVYDGTINAGDATVDGGWTVELSTPFAYNGGNLLVSYQINPNDVGGYTNINWYGINLTGASRSGYGLTNYNFTASGTIRNFLPKTTFTYGNPPTCFKVTSLAIDANATTTNSLTLTWTDLLNTGATYTVYNMADTSVVASNISGTTYTVTGLTANTSYSFAVMTDCGGGDVTGLTVPVSGRTACEAMGLPYTCGFEAGEIQSTDQATALPWCSQRYVSVAATSGTSYPYSYSTYAHESTRSLYFYGSTNAAYPDTMAWVMPQVDVTAYPMNGNRVSFWARMSSASYSKNVYVATMSDPTDMTTLTVIDSVPVSGTTHTKYTVSLATAAATDAYVVLAVLKGSGNLYMDDVTLEEVPACPDVNYLAVDSTTTSSVTLGWISVDGATGYTVYNMTDTTLLASNVTDTAYTVTGLTANTPYIFGVQSNCTSGDGIIVTVSVRTDCDVEALPFSETFDATLSSDPCWRGATGTTADEVLAGSALTLTTNNQWTYVSSVSNGIAAGHYRVNIYGTSCKKWMITPNIDLGTATNPLLTFDAAFTVYTSSSTDPATGFENNASQKFMILASTNDGQTWTLVNDIPLSSIASSTYVPQYVSLSAYAGQTVRLAFYAQSTTSGGDNNLHLDNILVEDFTGTICFPVSDLVASDITATSATFTWQGTADSYTATLMDATGDTVGTPQTVTGTTITFTGLALDNDYTVSVVANCGNDVSTAVTATAHIGYCVPNPTSVDNNGLTSVSFGGMTNTTHNAASGNAMYENFTSMSGSVPAGTTASIDITFATGYDYGTIIWVDWNNSLSFDADEVVYRGTSASSNPTTLTATFDIPATQDTGSYRMRILAADSYFDSYVSDATSTPDPCATFTWGVAEDYTLTVTEVSGNDTTIVDTASTCAITILAQDAYGDGWDAATLTVSQNGTTLLAYSMASQGVYNTRIYDTVTVNVSGDSPVVFTWDDGSASYTDEVSFAIVDGGRATVYTATDGSLLTNGVIFTLNSACPSCIAPEVTLVSVNTDTAIISWTGDAASYNVYNGTTFVANTTANTYTFTGLTAATGYTFGVVAVCSADDSSAMATITARTDCANGSCVLSVVTGSAGLCGAGIEVKQNGQTLGTLTDVSFSQATLTMDVCSGVPVELDYIQTPYTSWGYDSYISFTVYDGSGAVVYTCTDGSTMTEGQMVLINEPCPSCVVPEVTVSDVTTTSATISWTGTVSSYSVYNGTTYVDNVTANSYTFTGLTPGAAYTFGVVALCGTDDSSAMGTVNVNTACADIAIPFTEDFSDTSATIACWTTANTNAYTGVNDGAFRFVYNTNPPQYLISPELSGTTDGVQVSFLYRVYSTNYPESFALGYSTTTSDTSAFTWLTEQTNLTNTSYETYSENLPAGTKYVAIKYTANDMYYLYIDDVVFAVPPTCAPVSDLAVSGVTTSSMTLTWNDANNSGASYTVYNMADTSVVASNVSDTTYTVTGLTAGTAYTFGVVANCSATDASSMATISGMTQCAAVTTLPYNEGFEDGLGCWSTVNGSSDGMPWLYNASSSNLPAHGGTGMAASVSYYSGPIHANAWLISPQIVLPVTTDTLKLSWWHKVSAAYPTELYDVMVSTTTADTASFATTLLAVSPDSTSDWVQHIVDLSAYAGQSIYLAFHHHDSYDQYYLLLDDVEIFEGAYVPPAPDTLTVTFAVNDAAMGTTIPAPGTYQYLSGDTVTFGATPNTGYHFAYWVLAYDGLYDTVTYQNAYGTVDVFLTYWSNNVTLTAYFEAGSPDSVAVTYTVNDATMGSINPSGMQYVYVGAPIQAEATANSGYELIEWKYTIYSSTGAVLGGDSIFANDEDFANPITIGTIPQSFADNGYTLTMTAVFGVGGIVSEDSLVVITAVNDATMGTIIPAPGTHVFHAGDTFSVRAVPADGYHVSGWHLYYAYGDYVVTDTVIDMPYNEIVPLDTADYYLGVTMGFTAIFAPGAAVDYMTVTTIVNDTAMGSLTPQGTNLYHVGDTVLMSINVNPGYYLYSLHLTMTLPGYGTEDTTLMGDDIMAGIAELGLFDTAVVVDEYMLGASITVSAIFAADGTEPVVYNVTVGYDMSRGTVTGAGPYVEGSNVTLTAVAFPGYEFYAWVENNDTVGYNTVYTINNIDSDHYLTAVFVVSTGIDDVESDNVNVYSVDDMIVVRGAEGKQVVLFDVNGRMLSREANASERVEFRVSNSGVYMVKVGNAAAKRVVVLR